MLRLNGIKKLQLLILFLAMSLVVYAKVTGPEAGYTGASGDLGTCVACHDTYHTENVGPGSVAVSGGPIGGIYQLGQAYTLTITVQQSNRQRYGFQLTAIDKTLKRAGTFTTLNSETQVNSDTGAGGRQYIEHTQLGTTPNGTNLRTWQVRWTAPSSDVGTVRFNIAGNAANGDGTNQNDYIYTNSAITDSVTSFVGVTLASDPTGQTLQAASVFHLMWSTSGTVNIDNIEVRYSTDDGVTFPITNQIFFTTDASATTADWTVPTLLSTKAVLRVRVGKKSGDVVEAKSGRFSITDGSGPVGPVIFSASVKSNKKLIVNGQNFGDGATLYLCSECTTPATEGNKVKQVSNNEETPTTSLTAKKAGKTIERGSTVILQVKNPDGTLSEPFAFTRPL
jgi:hypothetical protein